jgi:hypothetical protein
MTEDEMMELGARAENLLRHPDFQMFSTMFEQSVVGLMLQTGPAESTRREELYAELNGHRQFILFVKEPIDAAKKLAEKNDPKAEIDDLDDPSVHEGFY